MSPTYVFRWFKGGIEKIFSPLQRSIYKNLGFKNNENELLKKISIENFKLKSQLVKLKTLEADIEALRTQLTDTSINSTNLISGHVIGIRKTSFSANPTELILDIGSNQGLSEGRAVIYEHVLLGKITQVSVNRAKVSLINTDKTVINAKTLKSNSEGNFKTEKNTLIFSDVLLSKKLESGDLLVTRGDVDLEGKGYPPDLIIGTINKVNKKPSALFQSASINLPLNFSELDLVFVILD